MTFINVWATWCGPCREELPHVQKLYEQLKDREDVAVVTFNTDHNTDLVAPFVKENRYTFPVLLAHDLFEKIAPLNGIPTNWLVDAEGIIRLETIGFGNIPPEKWLEQILARMEQTRVGK